MKCQLTSSYNGTPMSAKYNCFIFVERGSSKGDILYVGDECGTIYYFVVSRTSLINRQEELNPPEHRNGNHGSGIMCLLHSRNYRIASPFVLDKGGLLFSGGADRVIKVWAAAGNNKPLIQTLYGHAGAISGLSDGFDGTILSCSLDSTIRIWVPQGGRNLMLNPYFECYQVISVSPAMREIGRDAVWLTGIVINPHNSWRCYVSTSQGGVIVYGKAEDKDNLNDKEDSGIGAEKKGSNSQYNRDKRNSSLLSSSSKHRAGSMGNGNGNGIDNGNGGSISSTDASSLAALVLKSKRLGGSNNHSSQSSSRPLSAAAQNGTSDLLPLVCVNAWEGLHTLGISTLFIEMEVNLLVTLSFDCTCKILDASSGVALFTLQNRCHCMYTSVAWCPTQSSCYLVDEEGHIEIFNTFYEKSVDYLMLRPAGDSLLTELRNKRRENVVLGHRYPVLTGVSLHRSGEVGCIFSLFPAGIEAEVSNTNSYYYPPTGSTIIAWKLSDDVTCSEFQGHEGAIVSLAVVPAPVVEPISDNKQPQQPQHDILTAAPTQSHNQSHHQSSTAADTLRKTLISESHSNHNRIHKPAASRASTSTSRWAVMQVVSRDEFRFFSVAETDRSIRCWDEVDRCENFQFRLKNKAEPLCLCMLWSLNMLVIGLEDGSVCFMNADSGTQIMNRALKDTVACVVEGQHYPAGTGKGTVIAADFSGRVCCYEITDGYKVASTVFAGFHDIEDPSILSLAFHESSTTAFTGGSDGTIWYWQMNSTTSTADYHPRAVIIGNDEGRPRSRSRSRSQSRPHSLVRQASGSEEAAQRAAGLIYIPRERQISSLDCTNDFLLVGDESGELRLWAIIHEHSPLARIDIDGTPSEPSVYVGLFPPIRNLVLVARWTSPSHSGLHTGTNKAIGSLFQADVASVFIAQARGGRCTVWEVDLIEASVQDVGIGAMEHLEALLADPEAILKKREENMREPDYYIIDQCNENDGADCDVDENGFKRNSLSQTANGGTPDAATLQEPGILSAASRQKKRQSLRNSIMKFPNINSGTILSSDPSQSHRQSQSQGRTVRANSSLDARLMGLGGHRRSINRNLLHDISQDHRGHSLSLSLSQQEGEQVKDSVRQLTLTDFKMRAKVTSVAVMSHPDREVTCLRLSGSRRSDAPPNLLFVGTAQGVILRFRLSISAERMGENSAAKKRAKAAKTKMRRLLRMAVGMMTMQREARVHNDKRLVAPRTVELVKKAKAQGQGHSKG